MGRIFAHSALGYVDNRPWVNDFAKAQRNEKNALQKRIASSNWNMTCTPGRSRTYGTRFRKPLLYPLSYRGVSSRLTLSNLLLEFNGLRSQRDLNLR